MCEGIFFVFQENQSLLLADPASDAWKAYLDYVDEIVLDGFFTAIECSLRNLLENTGDAWLLSSGCSASPRGCLWLCSLILKSCSLPGFPLALEPPGREGDSITGHGVAQGEGRRWLCAVCEG